MKRIFAILTSTTLTAAPALADTFNGGITGGVFGGVVQSHSSGGSFANSSGIANNGNSGGSFARSENSAGHLAGAFGSYEGASNGRITKGTIVSETFSDGFSQSRTITRNNGFGTSGGANGWASDWGQADAAGAFAGGGLNAGTDWGGSKIPRRM